MNIINLRFVSLKIKNLSHKAAWAAFLFLYYYVYMEYQHHLKCVLYQQNRS